MLEGLVSSLLNRFLGAYIENFDPKQLNVGIWSGDVKLRNLKLKREVRICFVGCSWLTVGARQV
jgi:vacuolar protein sorting-associated protein 13A/C